MYTAQAFDFYQVFCEDPSEGRRLLQHPLKDRRKSPIHGGKVRTLRSGKAPHQVRIEKISFTNGSSNNYTPFLTAGGRRT